MYSGEYDICNVTLTSVPKYHILERPDREAQLAELWACIPKVVYRFDSHRGHAYSSSLSGVDIHSE